MEEDEISRQALKAEISADSAAAHAQVKSPWAVITPGWVPDDKTSYMLVNSHFMLNFTRGSFLPVCISPVSMALCHICWRSRPLTRLVVDFACKGIIEGNTREEIKPFFCALNAILGEQGDDGLKDWRNGWTMRHLLETMESQKIYLKATEASIGLLLRLVLSVREARAWLIRQANSEALEWIKIFLKNKEMMGPKISYKLEKSISNSGYSSSKHANENWGMLKAGTGRRATTGAASIKPVNFAYFTQVLDGSLEKDADYDSDTDPQEIIGRSINFYRRFKNVYDKVCQAKVVDFSNGEHWLLFESDGEPKKANLLEITFEFA